jgi:tetratricopeptide (TPR) repeat protein
MEQLKDVPAPQQRARNATLEVAYRTAADASYRLKEYAVADAEIRRAVELRKSIPPRTLGERRDEAAQASLAAMIAARLERYAEARRLIDPVLELHRELFARGDNEDLTQHIEFAQALYASALARPGGNAAELKQAAALIDALPPAMRGLVSVGRIRASITDAQGS